MDTTDTIAAVSSGSGGAISILRISGSKALNISSNIWQSRQRLSPEKARTMILGKINGGEPALAVYMPGPASYTGEDIVEIHSHGGNICARRALNLAIEAGARQAEPGEFTYRAFLNGKMDLTQAEAVADMINARNNSALKLSEKQISGLLKNKLSKSREALSLALSEIESRMDFPEEDLDWKSPEELSSILSDTQRDLEKLLATKLEGQVIREGVRVVIAGRPNAGKSSLLNLILGTERAIVTALPGTTRDTIEEGASIRNIPVRLTDTAGIREADNIIESMGIERSKDSIQSAEIIFWLLDASVENLREEIEEMKTHCPLEANAIAVWNKADISKTNLPDTEMRTVKISAKTGEGLDCLFDEFEKAVWHNTEKHESELAVSSRHAALLEEALECLPEAIQHISQEDWEIAAVPVRAAINAIGRITGETADPDVLDQIFSRFCIGK